MLIAGDLSGIQDYVLGVAYEGGQARRLRARSFFVQALAEAALVRILRSSGWSQVHLCAAGKFVLEGPNLDEPSLESLRQDSVEINAWLMEQTGGKIRFSLVWHNEAQDVTEGFARLMLSLQQQKLKCWSGVAIKDGRWNPQQFIGDPLDTPCAICRSARGDYDETDYDGVERRVCCRCHEDGSLGQTLPSAQWMLLHNREADYNVVGLGMDFQSGNAINVSGDLLAVTNLKSPSQEPPSLTGKPLYITRHLAAHVPRHPEGQLVEFQELAEKASGDHLLGVIKADGDRMGEYFNRLLEDKGWEGLSQGAQAIDHFFAGTLAQEMSSPNSRWSNIYTVFSGGDDLLLVGPWDLAIDFLGHIRNLFAQEFKEDRLTFSAGIAFIKPSRPIKTAADQAEHLLDRAKDAGRNRIAALGQIWEWDEHDKIITAARTLVQWIKQGAIERSWLHTLLDLVLLRLDVDKPPTERLCATFKVAYHVSRNWPKRTDRNPQKGQARAWADYIISQFDQLDQASDVQIRFLQVALRYALMATRAGTDR